MDILVTLMKRLPLALVVFALAGCGGGSEPVVPADPVEQVPDDDGQRAAVREAGALALDLVGNVTRERKVGFANVAAHDFVPCIFDFLYVRPDLERILGVDHSRAIRI